MYVSKLVRALQGDGFVTRAVKAADSRAVELALTEQGAVAVQEGVKIVYELRERLIRPLGCNHGARTAELAEMLRQLLDEPEEDRWAGSPAASLAAGRVLLPAAALFGQLRAGCVDGPDQPEQARP